MCVNKIHLLCHVVHRHVSLHRCPDLDACRKHVGKSGALFQYWEGDFWDRMITVDFNGGAVGQ